MNKERLNASGCRDDTAYEAIKNVSRKTSVQRCDYTKRDYEADKFVSVVKAICEAYGFRLIDRIRFEDPKTGRKYL